MIGPGRVFMSPPYVALLTFLAGGKRSSGARQAREGFLYVAGKVVKAWAAKHGYEDTPRLSLWGC